jgi:hypothetical protein
VPLAAAREVAELFPPRQGRSQTNGGPA